MPTPADTTSLIDSGRGTVDTLMNQAADQAALGADVGTRIQEQFGTWQGTADAVAIHGLLPLAMTLLILHHFYQCAVEDKPFSVRYILVRTGVVAGLLLSYGFLVGLITSVAGSQGDWADWSQLMTPIEKGWKKRWDLYDSGFYLEDLPNLLLWLVFFAIVAFCALLALAASLLLSIAQGTLLAIILALGKTCIVASLVPGISLGKSWAKYLAMVAAWSSVAGVVHAIVLGNPKIAKWGHLAATTDIKYLLGLAALYLVFAVFTLAVPNITGALFSGAGSHAPGVMGALAMGVMGARKVGQMGGRAARAGDEALGELRKKLGIPRNRDNYGGGSRPHKTHHRARGEAGSRNPRRGATTAAAAQRRPLARNASIPPGAPGGARFDATASARQRELWSQHNGEGAGPDVAPPGHNDAMQQRIQEQAPTLAKAYPDRAIDPQAPTSSDRALLDELDNPHGRFAGWDRGKQGAKDFALAEGIANRRARAARDGGARPPAPYRPPRWAATPVASSAPVKATASAMSKPSGGAASTAARPAGAGSAAAPRAPVSTTAPAMSRTIASSNASPPPSPTAARTSHAPGSQEATAPRGPAVVTNRQQPAQTVHTRVVPRSTQPASSSSEPQGQTRSMRPAHAEPPQSAAPRVHKLPPKGGR